MHHACSNCYLNFKKHFKVIQILLEAGAKTDAQNENGETPFFVFVKAGFGDIDDEVTNLKMLKDLFIQYGSDLNIPNNEGETPAFYYSNYTGHYFRTHNDDIQAICGELYSGLIDDNIEQ